MNFPFYIAKRYLFSRSNNNAINIISLIAAIGVIVGAMALFIVLSGFAGLKDFSLQFTNVFDSDLKIIPATGKTINFSKASEEKLNQIKGIAGFSAVIEERIFLHFRDKNEIAYIKGVDGNYGNVNPIDSILVYDSWLIPNQKEVVIGIGILQKLSLGTRDYSNLLEIYVPKPYSGQNLDPSKAFSKENVVVTGIYDVNEDINSKYVFSDLSFARTLLKLDSTKISSVELKLLPGVSEDDIRDLLIPVFS